MSGGSSKQSQQLDPAFRDAFLQNLQDTKGVAGNLQARQFAGFNPDQEAGFNIARQFADPNSEAFAGMRQAFGQATTAANYSPQQVASRDVNAALAQGQGYTAAQSQGQGYTSADSQSAQLARNAVRDVKAQQVKAAQAARSGARDVGYEAVSGADVASEALSQIAPEARGNIRDITAGSFLNQNIQQYMNPYTQAVTDQSLADLERSRQLQQQQTSAQATAAKAFGGSRQGVAEAETNRAFDENAARLVAQQNAAAYQAAQQASEADLARQMQAQQLNQAQDAATTQQALALSGQFGLANQDAAIRTQLANQGVDVQYGLTNAQLKQQAAIANQQAALQAALSNQGFDFNVGQLNTQNQQQVNLANQAARNQAGQFGASAQNQAALANQAALNQAGQFGAGAMNQASLANQAARNQVGLQNAQNFLQANLANQGAGLTSNQQRLGASGQMANISQAGQNMGFAGAENLATIGNQQQQLSQQQLDAIRNLPLEQQQIINQALGLNVGGGSGVQSSSTSRQGLLGLLGL